MNNQLATGFQKFHPIEDDTIAAISTPYGESGIGIVRMSGPLAEPIAKRIFKAKKRECSQFVSHHFHYGEIVDPRDGHVIDEVLLVLMKAPKTYTREDIVEIHCHGGYFLLQKVLELVLKEGARIAQPGEFTKRAFLNGRIDLTQAEAVIDLIKAKTKESLEIAQQQLKGLLYNEMLVIKERLINDLALIEVHIDFPEEDIEPISFEKLKEDLNSIKEQIEEMLLSFEEGRVFREGISCAITGKTNVGKSSLLNVLLKEDRAIVTPIPGTTRDVIEEVINIRGIPIRLIDTAGLRGPIDFIEQEGIKRAKEKIANADLIILVIDRSKELEKEDIEIFEEIKGKKKIVCLNKKDLAPKIHIEDLRKVFQEDSIVTISALKNEGIEDLREAIYSSIIKKGIRRTPDHLIITHIRHKEILSKIKESLLNGIEGLEEGKALEIIAFEIRLALEALSEMVGETTTDEILNRIFEEFCIGK